MKRATIAFLAFTIFTIGVHALTTWRGTIQWTLATKTFEVWNAETGGTKLTSPYTLTEPNPLSIGDHVYNFWLENTGTITITITATTFGTPVGCTASWSSSGVYSVPVGTTRVQVVLTLTISASGSYSWDFVVS